MATRPSRWGTVKMLIGFQVKLALDGLKDLVLSPLATAAALVGVLFERERPARHLQRVLRLGRRYDEWLDLFGAADDDPDAPARDGQTLDQHLAQLGRMISEQSRRGALSERNSKALEQALRTLERAAAPASRTAPADAASSPSPDAGE
ncbi:hypothetical protein Hoch_5802 [Haliangium ochraceum DSM 14365]|uniref:Uncharacterized protein n=1 Tax=Haliangium ochraceum (strain DSM 14365 / JCM 11303 / SMP-2) TaxID=502025 RepID=D0LHD3_HALO1|nr:hypothetical protein Hoch_5802 [Haliangium ochraceum DSM 14365]